MDDFERFKVEEEGSYLERMLDGTPYWPEMEIPGWRDPIRIRPLGRGVELRCHADAQTSVAKRGLDLNKVANKLLADEEAVTRILFEALITHDSTPRLVKRLATTYDEFAAHPSITDNTISYLWTEYVGVKARVSPYVSDMTEERVSEIREAIKKNRSRTPLASLPREQLMDLIVSLVCADET